MNVTLSVSIMKVIRVELVYSVGVDNIFYMSAGCLYDLRIRLFHGQNSEVKTVQ